MTAEALTSAEKSALIDAIFGGDVERPADPGDAVDAVLPLVERIVADRLAERQRLIDFTLQQTAISGVVAGMPFVRQVRATELRDAAAALNVDGLRFKAGGWGSNPADQQTIDALVKTLEWLRARANRIEDGQ